MVEVSLAAMALPLDQALLARPPSPREFCGLLPCRGRSGAKSACAQIRTHLEDHGQSAKMLMYGDCTHQASSMAEKPVFIDMQDPRADSILFSFGIAEQCNRQEKIVKFLTSAADGNEKLDPSLLSEIMGTQFFSFDLGLTACMLNDNTFYHEAYNGSQLFLTTEKHVLFPNLPLNWVENQPQSETLCIDENGRVHFTGTGDDFKDLISYIAEFDTYNRSSNRSRASLLVPYFDRKRRGGRRATQSSAHNLKVDSTAPSKSSDAAKLKSVSKRRSGRANKERDLYQKNYFHACEALLSVVLDKNKGSMTILSLKRSGPEIAQMLQQFSVGIAGTGLAVLFSVACRTPGSRASVTSARLLNTGVGLGLFWLSWAVSGLRDTVTSVFKDSDNGKHKEALAGRVERSMNAVIFRAVALAALAALRFI